MNETKKEVLSSNFSPIDIAKSILLYWLKEGHIDSQKFGFETLEDFVDASVMAWLQDSNDEVAKEIKTIYELKATVTNLQ